MSIQYEKLEKCYEYYRSVTGFMPKVGSDPGVGPGRICEKYEGGKGDPLRGYPRIPVSTVQGHDVQVYAGLYRRCAAVVMKGRVHYYEGYPMEDVVLPTRLMKRMGIEVLFLTIAAGRDQPGIPGG